MSIQDGRQWQLVIGDDESINVPNALKIDGGLRIKFKVVKDNLGTPNISKISIYNLTQHSRSKIEKPKSKLLLKAGYENNLQVLFFGDVLFVQHRKIGAEIISEIYAGDGQESYLKSRFSKTYSKTASNKEIVEDVVASFEGLGVSEIKGVPDGNYSLFGSTFSSQSQVILSNLASDLDLEWFIDNEGLYVNNKKTEPNNTVLSIFNATNGMIGSPIVTEVGINLNVLMRPSLLCNTNFRVESVSPSIQFGNYFFKGLPPTKGEGIYRIIKLIHQGDTHSNEWSTFIEGTLPF